MEITIMCHSCGHVMYKGTDITPFYRLKQQNKNKCPNCKRKLTALKLNTELKRNFVTQNSLLKNRDEYHNINIITLKSTIN